MPIGLVAYIAVPCLVVLAVPLWRWWVLLAVFTAIGVGWALYQYFFVSHGRGFEVLDVVAVMPPLIGAVGGLATRALAFSVPRYRWPISAVGLVLTIGAAFWVFDNI